MEVSGIPAKPPDLTSSNRPHYQIQQLVALGWIATEDGWAAAPSDAHAKLVFLSRCRGLIGRFRLVRVYRGVAKILDDLEFKECSPS